MSNSKQIKMQLPKGFTNVKITTSNNVVADNNNPDDWNDLIFPLPKGQWKIQSVNDRIVMIERG